MYTGIYDGYFRTSEKQNINSTKGPRHIGASIEEFGKANKYIWIFQGAKYGKSKRIL